MKKIIIPSFSLFVAVCALLAATAVYLDRPALQPTSPIMRGWLAGERVWVIERMKYHGIDGCIQGEDGQYYFYRNGKKCKL